jgi:arylsulfatase A-like enzyme
VALLPFTEEAPPTTVIRPGDPADHGALLRGWSAPVTLPDGTVGARIGNERIAALVFHAGPKPQPLTVTIDRTLDVAEPVAATDKHGRPARPRRSRMVLRVNGQLVRRSTGSLDSPTGVYEVPVEVLQAGRNLITINEPGTRRRRRPDRPAVPRWVYTQIVFKSRGVPVTTVRGNGDRLVIPAGAEVSYFFLVPEDARLRVTAASDGKTAGHLTVALRVDGEPRRMLLDRDVAPGEEIVQQLDTPLGVPVRLTLAGDTQLLRPVVEGRPSAARVASVATALEGRPNVILYLADTLRADRLGCYGAEPSRAPAIDRFAATSVVFENAVAQAPWTRPSTATILTGHYPVTHGAITLRTPLRTDLPTLATMLGKAGWKTQAFVTNLNVAPSFGFGKGFDGYEYLPEDPKRPGVYEPAAVLHEKALAWLASHRGEPFFLYLHATDPHAPYRPVEPAHLPAEFSEDDRTLLNRTLNEAPDRISDAGLRVLHGLYDGETTEFDAEFGRFLDALGAQGVMNDTLLVFLADHGEEFHEHGGFQHGRTLYDEVMRIPLIIHLPGGREGGRRVSTLARQVDVVPTIRSLLGLPADPDLPGRRYRSPKEPLPARRRRSSIRGSTARPSPRWCYRPGRWSFRGWCWTGGPRSIGSRTIPGSNATSRASTRC